MDLILFGMQGSGKGTQAKILMDRCNFVIFEAGGALRTLAQEDSDLGRKVQEIMHAGHLVPTEVVMEIVEDFFTKIPEGKSVIFDGIPRSTDQQEQFDAMMARSGRDYRALLIELTEEEALKRLTTRRICENCKAVYPATYEKEACEACGGKLVTRHDDTPDAILTRLQTFSEKTVPVIEDYRSKGKLLVVNGMQSIDRVTADTMETLSSYIECK